MFSVYKDMDNNLKDNQKNSLTDTSSSPTSFVASPRDRNLFYTKTDKLITALYMVTDMIDKDEPIRHRLRTLGTEIISDMHLVEGINSSQTDLENAIKRTMQVVSFLNIASAMNFISEMNSSILKKEFLELKRSLDENKETKPTWLTEFLTDAGVVSDTSEVNKGHNFLKGQTRIGVQKGSTLMQALSDKTHMLSGENTGQGTSIKTGGRQDFEILKTNRRSEIITVIKSYGGSATIKDIKVKMDGGGSGSLTYSEKTLQRELVSMTKEGIINKTGKKRWSRYFLKNNPS